MPSWNIHMEQVQRLFEDPGAEALGIRDPNVFLFGNVVPDIYVGYMVKPITRRIDYRKTHFAPGGQIPVPREHEFWDRYVAGPDARGEDPGDLVLGAWAHIAADNYWNSRVRAYNAQIGVRPGEYTRIRKQADFDQFGKRCELHVCPVPTEALFRACAAFPQYPIEREDAERALEVCRRIVETNRPDEPGPAHYLLLTPEFFSTTMTGVLDFTRERLVKRARALAARRAGR